MYCLMEALLKIVSPEQCVIYALSLVGYVSNYFIISPGIAITRCSITLGSSAITIPAPRSYECRQVAIIRMEENAVVSIPSIKYSLQFPMWYTAGLVERRLCVMGFPSCMDIQGLEVNGSSWFTCLFSTNDHPVAPGHRFSNWYWFNHTQVNILVQSSLHSVLPVECHWYWRVVGNWFCSRIYH